MRTKAYIIEDSITIRAMMEIIIGSDRRFEVAGLSADAETALVEINSALPNLILLDIGLPGIDGLDFLDRIHDHWHAMKVVVVSGSATHNAPLCTEALNRGAAACFDKARLSTRAEEFLGLLEEVSTGRALRRRHRGDAVTLPGLPPPRPAEPLLPLAG